MNIQHVPLVPGAPVLGNLRELKRDRFGLQLRVARDVGAVARVRVPLKEILMVTDPQVAHAVLVEHESAFMKGPGLSIFARPLLGDGLLTSEGAVHKKHRRMLAPLFVHKHVAAYADTMASLGEQSARAMLDAGEVDLAEAMMDVTLRIVENTLFGSDALGERAREIGDALTEAMSAAIGQIVSAVPLPPRVPSPSNLRGRRAAKRLDRIVYPLIDERRRSGAERYDLLSLLLSARDEEDGQGLTDVQIRDEAMTLLLAGHETTANAVTWATYLLARNPEARAKLEAEVDAVLGGRRPDATSARALPYTLMVLKEAMRLYPPAYALVRRALRPVTIGGLSLGAGQVVMINVAGLHRRPEWFPRPDAFEPERFLAERERALPKGAYLPFGGGSRVCIGNHFALMEGQILLATFAQRARAELLSLDEPAVEPLFTLRPQGGIRVRVTARA